MFTHDVRSASDIGAAMAEVRRRRGLSQHEMFAMAGPTASYVSKIETGRSTPLQDHELRISRAT